MVRARLSGEGFDLRPDVEKAEICEKLISKTSGQRNNTQRHLVGRVYYIQDSEKIPIAGAKWAREENKKLIWKRRLDKGKVCKLW